MSHRKLCEWSSVQKVSEEKFIFTCRHCGFSEPRPWPRLTRLCDKPRLPVPVKPPCVHLGAELRLDVCPTCCGETWVKVFACPQHGECTRLKKIGELMVCQRCPNYVAKIAAS